MKIIFISLIVGIILGVLMFLFSSAKTDSIKIADPTNFIVSKMGECNKAPRRSECLKEAARFFLKEFSLKQVLAVFEKNETREELISICHEETHYLGRGEYQTVKDIKDVFSSCNHSCLGGCYHGAVEGYFIEKNITIDGENDSQVAKEMPTLCGQQKDYQTPQQHTECLHGLGHAVMFLTENDLIRSLKLCDNLKTKSEQDLCYTGAFMANVDGENSQDHPSKYFKRGDDLYPCTILDKKYLDMCYTYAVLQPHQTDLEKTINICKQVPNEFQLACFRTMGRDRVYNTDDEEEMKKECDLIDKEEFRQSCYIGTVGSLVVRYGIDSQSPFKYCAILDNKFKERCYSELGLRLTHWTKDLQKLHTVCSQISQEQYRNQCIKSAGSQ